MSKSNPPGLIVIPRVCPKSISREYLQEALYDIVESYVHIDDPEWYENEENAIVIKAIERLGQAMIDRGRGREIRQCIRIANDHLSPYIDLHYAKYGINGIRYLDVVYVDDYDIVLCL